MRNYSGKKMFLTGEVSRREAISKQNLENASRRFARWATSGAETADRSGSRARTTRPMGAREIEAKIAAMLP